MNETKTTIIEAMNAYQDAQVALPDIDITGKKIKVGATVNWRGSWGRGIPKRTTIKEIELCEREGDKYGESVQSIWATDKNRSAFVLENGHWAYGHQIDLLKESLSD